MDLSLAPINILIILLVSLASTFPGFLLEKFRPTPNSAGELAWEKLRRGMQPISSGEPRLLDTAFRYLFYLFQARGPLQILADCNHTSQHLVPFSPCIEGRPIRGTRREVKELITN